MTLVSGFIISTACSFMFGHEDMQLTSMTCQLVMHRAGVDTSSSALSGVEHLRCVTGVVFRTTARDGAVLGADPAPL